MPESSQLDQFLAQFSSVNFTKGELVMELDQELSHLLYLKQGYIRQYSVSSEGEEFTHNIYKPGSIFPLNLIFSGQDNPYYFEGQTKGKIVRVPSQKMLDFFQEHPQVLYQFTQKLAAGINQLLYRMESLVFGSAQQKVAAAIYLLAKKFGNLDNQEKQSQCPAGKPGFKIVSFPVTHQQLAYLTALTRETVSVEMMNLKEMGLIDYRNQQICLLKPEQLKEVSSLPFYF